MNKSNILKLVIIIMVIVGVLMLTYNQVKKQKQVSVDRPVIAVGFKNNQTGLLKEMEKASVQASYSKKGSELLREGNIEEAIIQYEIALKNAYSQGGRGVALAGLERAYEKKRDYQKALELLKLARDEYVSDWAKEPIIERIKYLEYALQGNYAMAVKHAELALEADKKLPNRPKEGSEDYIERLNDLKAAKGYIESLK